MHILEPTELAEVVLSGSMSFGKSVKAAFLGWNRYQGVSTRPDFWWFQLFSVLSFLGLAIIGALVLEPFGETGLDIATLLFVGYFIILFIIGLSVTVRRLRDAGLAWGLIFLHFVPLIGAALLYVFALFPSKNSTAPSVEVKPSEKTTPSSADDEIESKLLRLAKLRDDGTISDEKFEAAKRKLLENEGDLP